jgi:transcriptional regulator GlxA family with amidase domain
VHQVAALALPEVVAFDLAIPSQIFGHRDERQAYAFTLCAPRAGPVPTTSGYSVVATAGLEALSDADTVVVPGYAPHDPPAGPVLDGRRATTHWRDAAELARRHPAVTVDAGVLYVDEGQILTSAGVAAGIDLCLHIVRRDLGADEAARIARRMVVAPHRDGGQAQFVDVPLPAVADSLASTCAWALDHLADALTVADLAGHAGWAPRTFARRFVAEVGTTPLRWLTAQRVLHARRMLETTSLSVDAVASASGLGTAANLRLHLARTAGTTPTAYRRTFRGGTR